MTLNTDINLARKFILTLDDQHKNQQGYIYVNSKNDLDLFFIHSKGYLLRIQMRPLIRNLRNLKIDVSIVF